MKILKETSLDRHTNSAESAEDELSEIQRDLCETIDTKASSPDLERNCRKVIQDTYSSELGGVSLDDESAPADQDLDSYVNDPEMKKEIEKANKEEEKRIQEEFDKEYDKRIVYNIFLVVFVANILINVDHGALPGCYEQITHKLEINKFQYGVLGSFVFAGLTLGSIVSTALYSKGRMIKPILLTSLLLNSIVLLLFTVSTSYYFLLFLRGATGFFQIFLVVYQPVWTDTFCEEKFKSIALTINMLAAPLGIVLGYVLTYYMVQYHTWEWSFYLQGFAIVPCFVILMFMPEKYLNVEMTVNKKKQIQRMVGEETLKNLDSSRSMESQELDVSGEVDSVDRQGLTSEQILKRVLIKNQKKKEENMSGFQQENDENLAQKIQSVVSNPVFCGLVSTQSGLYFVVTGLQYWMSAYMTNVMGASAELAAFYYVSLCFTGPIMGVIAGGIITQYVGGYNSTKGQLLICLVGILAVLSGMPVPFCDNIHFMALFLWLLLFFGGFMTPQIIGIMLNSVEESKRMSANSLATLSFNLIGYLPAPTFYGFIAQICGNETSKVPMACLLFTTFFTISALLLSIQRKLESQEKFTILTRVLGKKASPTPSRKQIKEDPINNEESPKIQSIEYKSQKPQYIEALDESTSGNDSIDQN